MNFLYQFFLEPFADFSFMRRALVACWALAFGCGPIGVILILRRMSLIGDAMSHAILPGTAIGFLISGFSLTAMSVGGFVMGLGVALLSGFISRFTHQKEDASFATFYLISLALGVLLISNKGSSIDLLQVLFGSILAVDNTSLILLACISTITLTTLAIIYRPLIVECFDPDFLKSAGASGIVYHFIFLILVVFNLVGGFQALGTLMAIGLMILPAATAKFWTAQVWSLSVVAIFCAIVSGYFGLLISYHFNLPSGPSVILTSGLIYIGSIFVGKEGGMMKRIIHSY